MTITRTHPRPARPRHTTQRGDDEVSTEYEARAQRRAIARVGASSLFAAALTAGLVATWTWSPRWAITAGVLLFAAFVIGLVAIP